MNERTVSVIIPVYNAEKTLPECLNSILNQTYSNFEIILIDDGSTDGSSQLCDAIRDDCIAKDIRCKVIHQENGGVSRARNCGIDNVSGEYFICIDSDDTVEPCYIEELVKTQEQHGEAGMVLCGYRDTSKANRYVYAADEELSFVDRKDYMKLADKVLIQTPWLRLYKTDIVKRHGLRMREDLSLGEDLVFNLEYLDVMDNTALCIINRENYVYRDDNQGSLNRKYRKDLLEIKELLHNSIKSYLVKWGVTDEASWESYYNSAFYAYLGVLDNTFSERNPMTKREKIAYNSTVMKSAGFKEALSKFTGNLSPRLRRVYESGDYRQVLAINFAARVKYSIKNAFVG